MYNVKQTTYFLFFILWKSILIAEGLDVCVRKCGRYQIAGNLWGVLFMYAPNKYFFPNRRKLLR